MRSNNKCNTFEGELSWRITKVEYFLLEPDLLH